MRPSASNCHPDSRHTLLTLGSSTLDYSLLASCFLHKKIKKTELSLSTRHWRGDQSVFEPVAFRLLFFAPLLVVVIAAQRRSLPAFFATACYSAQSGFCWHGSWLFLYAQNSSAMGSNLIRLTPKRRLSAHLLQSLPGHIQRKSDSTGSDDASEYRLIHLAH